MFWKCACVSVLMCCALLMTDAGTGHAGGCRLHNVMYPTGTNWTVPCERCICLPSQTTFNCTNVIRCGKPACGDKETFRPVGECCHRCRPPTGKP